MRILMLHNRYLQTGGEDGCFQMEVDLLRRFGCDVVTFEENNTRIEDIGVLRTALRSVWSLESYRKVRKILRDKDCDVLHVQNFFPLLSPSVYYAARADGVPVVQTLHNYRLMCPVGTFSRDGQTCEDCSNKVFPWPGIAHRCYRDSMTATTAVGAMISINRAIGTWHDKVDAYIVLTEFMRQKYIAGGFPAEKLYIKPNFLDPDPQPGSGAGGYAFYAGRLEKEKGIATLLKAWERIGSDLPLKIAGEGSLEPDVKAAKERGYPIEFLGWQSPDEVLELMGKATILLQPTELFEGHPRVAVEAFARGLPVVASRIGAMTEMVEDGVSGILFNPGDPDHLAEKVAWAVNNSAELSAIGANARREFEKKYAADQNFEILMDIYRSAIATANSAMPSQPVGSKSQ